jgi:ADP-heptose:LPS heptosyltransferase
MNIRRILVIQLRQLGDTLMSTPLVRQVARLYPGAEIDFLCQGGNACILRNNPHIARIEKLPRGAGPSYFLRLAARLRRRRYDMVIDVQSLPKTALLARLSGAPRRIGFDKRSRSWLYTDACRVTETEYTVIHRLRLLQDDGVDLGDLGIDFPVDTQTRSEAAEFCQRWLRAPVAAIYGVGQLASRIWPARKFAAIGDRLGECGFQPYLIYGPGELEGARKIAELMRYPAVIDYPMLSFPVLKETIAACELMVTDDGGPKHLATAAETPCVTVFNSPAMATLWNPPGRPDMRVVTTRSDQKPMAVEGTSTDAETLAEISVDAVWAEIEVLIQQARITKPRGAA